MKSCGKNLKVTGFLSLMAIGAFSFASCEKKKDDDGARILHIGNGGEPLTLDPHQTTGTWENRILSDMYVGLTTSDKDGKAIPGMASEWTTSPDGLTWTFKLRDAKWSDGTIVSANDFVFSFQRLFTTQPAAKNASLFFIIKNAEEIFTGKAKADTLGVRAIDAKTLEITLNNPAPYLPGLLINDAAMPLPKHILEKHNKDWLKPQNIVTNGAFKIVEWAPNDYIKVSKNPLFYDEANVCLNDVYYYPTQDDASAERSVRTGALDVQLSFSGTRLGELEKTLPGFARVSPYLATTYFVFNTKKPIFKDERVREALSLAINREFITDHILKGGQKPAYSLVPEGINGYAAGASKLEFGSINRQARLDKARKLLSEAGYGPQNPLKFTYKYRNSGDNPRLAPVVQQNWREIASWVDVEIIGSDVQLNYEKLRQGDFDVGDSGWSADFDDARSFLFNFQTQAGQMNYGKYSNPQFDKLLIDSDKTPDAKIRANLMLQAEKILMDTDAIIPLYFYTSRNLVNPRITNWVDNVNDYHRTRFLCTKEAETQSKK
jgi:oligopeptide transport system substrate-binding protein